MLILIVVAVITILATVMAYKLHDEYFGIKFVLNIISAVVAIISGIVMLLLICGVIIANVGVEGEIATKEQKYESLVYQLENNLYDNDNDLGKKELYNEIRDWNASIAAGKAMQYNPWFGVFYPDIYDRFELIELK